MDIPRRNSRQRTLIYETVRALSNHPNAEEIYRTVRQQLPEISLGTVYRNLNLLEEMGRLVRIHTGVGPDRFDATLELHPHLVCSSCGGVFDLDCCIGQEMDLLKRAFERSGAQIDGVQARAFGICEQCREQKR